MAINDLEKMDNYNPTNYVNNSEPDIDADNLNKTENKLAETVEKANQIIDALKTLISTVQTNSETTVPSSSLAYSMQQAITNNTENIATINSNLKVGTTTVLASGQAGAIRTSNIIFDTSFSKMPSISVAIYNEYPSVFQATISKVTKLGFSLYLETIKETSEQSVLVHWIASAK